jgi:hypothetical protein
MRLLLLLQPAGSMQVPRNVIDLLRRNVSHVSMESANHTSPMPKLISAVFVLLTLLFLTSAATGQQAQATHHRRGHLPDGASANNGYQVWAGIDLSDYWMPSQNAAARSTSFPESHLYADATGIWGAEEISGLILTLLPNGNFSLATSADLQMPCSSGVERGNWAVHEETSQLLFHIKTDTNGACGFSAAAMTMHKTATGLMLTTAGRDVPLVRR